MQGNDVLSQVLNATPLTLEIVLVASVLAITLAICVGIASGTFGGSVDTALSAVTSVFLVIPAIPLAMVVAGVVPRGRHTAVETMTMVGLATWAAEARVLRAQALSLRNADFVAAATVAGESRWRIALHELVPNMASRIAAGFFFVAIQVTIVLATLDFLASLSRGRFALGDTNGTTWGSLIAEAQTGEALLTGAWWDFAFPALALIVTAAGLVLTMYAIEQVSDPRLRGRTPIGRLIVRAPRLRLPELRSPLPALATFTSALPHIGRHIAHRLPIYAGALWLSATIAFALPRLAWQGRLVAPPPSGPFWSGYGHFLAHLGLAPGVWTTVRESLPFSLALVGTATVLAFLIGSSLGLIAAWRRGGAFDGSVTTTTAIIWTIPAFAIAGVALELFGVRWGLFPIQWAYGLDVVPSWNWAFAESAFRHAQLPLIILVVSSLGLWVLEHAHGHPRRRERRLRAFRPREGALRIADHAPLRRPERASADDHGLRSRVRAGDRRRSGARGGVQLLRRRLGAATGGDQRQSAARAGAGDRDCRVRRGREPGGRRGSGAAGPATPNLRRGPYTK